VAMGLGFVEGVDRWMLAGDGETERAVSHEEVHGTRFEPLALLGDPGQPARDAPPAQWPYPWWQVHANPPPAAEPRHAGRRKALAVVHSLATPGSADMGVCVAQP